MPQPYDPCYFEAKGIEVKVSPRKAKAANRLLSSPFAISQSYRPATATYRRGNGTDSGKPIEGLHRACDRASPKGDQLNIFYFDRNRSRHLTPGTYRTTFERICDDLNWRLVREINKDETKKQALVDRLGDDYFATAKAIAQGGVGAQTADELAAFLDDARYGNLRLDLVNYLNPFETARLVVREDGELAQVRARDLGSGVEVILALLMLKNVAGGSSGRFVYLVDEPEAHLHPKAQHRLLELLIEESRDSQVFLSTHSPYMFQHALDRAPGIFTFTLDGPQVRVQRASEVGGSLFPWGPTWGELSYRAYGLPSVEFHNEIYGFIQERTQCFREADIENYLTSKGVPTSKSWVRLEGGNPQPPYAVTLSTYVRHEIHHPENTQNPPYTEGELIRSIETLISILEGSK
jgi:hypothetical protein